MSAALARLLRSQAAAAATGAATAAARASADAALALLVYEPVRHAAGSRFELGLQMWPHHPQVHHLGHGGGPGIPFTWR